LTKDKSGKALAADFGFQIFIKCFFFKRVTSISLQQKISVKNVRSIAVTWVTLDVAKGIKEYIIRGFH